MRSGTTNKLFVVVFCLFTAMAVQAQPDDATVPWDPADHLTAHWNYVSLTARLYNPVEQPDRAADTERSLTVSGEIDIFDPNGLVALSTSWPRTAVFDANDNEIYSTPDDYPRFRSYRALRTRPMLGGTSGITFGLGEHLSVSVPMDPNLGYPSLLSRIEYSVGALIAETSETIDVPFAASEDWMELVPGLQIFIEEASVESGRYGYRIKFEYDPNQVSYGSGLSLHIRADDIIPPMVLTGVEILDANGVSVRDRSSGGSFSGGSGSSGSGGLMTGTTTASGSCTACGEAAIIRHTFAVAPYEQDIQFVLEDIPVPDF